MRITLGGNMSDNKHPVRFTRKQINFVKHAMVQFYDYFEEEAEDILETVEKAEEE
jgi:hypothetical protein